MINPGIHNMAELSRSDNLIPGDLPMIPQKVGEEIGQILPKSARKWENFHEKSWEAPEVPGDLTALHCCFSIFKKSQIIRL